MKQLGEILVNNVLIYNPMKTFGNIKVDDDRYIVIPIVIDGVHRTDYEISPYMVCDRSLCEWVEHMRSKSVW